MANAPQPPPPPEGRVTGLINAVRGLTLTNALVIAILIVVAGPSYIAYRAINDETLLNRFMATYRIVPTTSGCSLHEVGERGTTGTWVIATGFAFQGNDRWQIGVSLNRRPAAEEEASYCETLKLLVDHMRDPSLEMPTFPGSNRPIIRVYPEPPPFGYGGAR